MEVHHLDFGINDASAAYFIHNTPPHLGSTTKINTNLYQLLTPITPSTPPPPPDEAFQMQYLRFPTPPITPPRFTALHHFDTPKRQRTTSVIMKVGQGDQGFHHVPADINKLDELVTSQEGNSSESYTQNNIKDYICDWMNCGRYFESLESLAAHVTLVHANSSLSGLYYCNWKGCPRTARGFNARYKMLVHVRTHTKYKPHQCNLCEKSFSRAENLKIHIRSHSGEKPYICTFEGCLKAYSNSSDRFKHTRTHSMEKPYMCKVPGCLKRYTDPSSLRKHVKTFKHSLQIIDDPATVSVKNYLTTNSRASDSIETANIIYNSPCHRIEENNSSTSSSREEYWSQSETSEMYHNGREPTSVSSYCSSSNLPSAIGYWLPDDRDMPTKLRPYSIHENEFSMDLNVMDIPLDLRVNRR